MLWVGPRPKSNLSFIHIGKIKGHQIKDNPRGPPGYADLEGLLTASRLGQNITEVPQFPVISLHGNMWKHVAKCVVSVAKCAHLHEIPVPAKKH